MVPAAPSRGARSGGAPFQGRPCAVATRGRGQGEAPELMPEDFEAKVLAKLRDLRAEVAGLKTDVAEIKAGLAAVTGGVSLAQLAESNRRILEDLGLLGAGVQQLQGTLRRRDRGEGGS